MTPLDLSLYLVLDPVLCADAGLVETAVAAVRGGATAVQLRHNTASSGDRVAIGKALREALLGSGAHIIVNADVRAALEIGADGVHLGQSDMALEDARMLVGPELHLGISVTSVAAATSVNPHLVTHVSVGPVHATPTAPHYRETLGHTGLASVLGASPVPGVAVGGIKADDIEPALASGAMGVAVVSAICGQPDPEAAARVLRSEIDRVRSRARTLTA